MVSSTIYAYGCLQTMTLKYKNKLGVLLCVFFLLLVLWPWLLQREEQQGLALLFTLRGTLPSPDNIAIIGIDKQSSLALKLPSSPTQWSRDTYAMLLRQIYSLGAKLIVLDVAFKESRAEEDDLLAATLRDAGNVLLFQYVERHTQDINNIGRVDIQQPLNIPDVLQQSALAAGNFTLPLSAHHVTKVMLYRDFGFGVEPTLPVLTHMYSLLPFTPLTHDSLSANNPSPNNLSNKNLSRNHLIATYLTALDNQFADILRRTHPERADIFKRLLVKTASGNHDIASAYSPASVLNTISSNASGNSLANLGKTLVRPATLYINFYGPSKTITTVSMLDLLSGELNVDLSGYVIFVGLSESVQTAQFDTHKTVFTQDNGLDLSGVEILATVFSNIVNDEAIQPIPQIYSLGIVVLILLGAFFGSIFLPFRSLLFLQLAVFGIYLVIAYYLFLSNVWLPIWIPCIAWIVINSSLVVEHYFYTRHRNRIVVARMSRYIPADIARTMGDEQKPFETQRQLVQGVCLLTDLSGYSRLSEKLAPDKLHALLNQYYGVLEKIVREHDGQTINIVGDSLLAIWRANVVNKQMAEKALHTAIRIQYDLRQSSELVSLAGCTSIGIHAGPFSLGNLGGGQHFEYSTVGDTVNTVARIEKINRKFGTHLLLSEQVCDYLPDYIFNYVGTFELHNKLQTVKLFQAVGGKHMPLTMQCEDDLVSTNEVQCRKRLNAITLFEAGEVIRAKSLFFAFKKEYGHCPIVEYYLKIINGPSQSPVE